jgi:aminopeptidase N
MKSAYEMFIDTDTGYLAACNGISKLATQNPNGTVTWHYYESKPMSAYLASVSVSKYALIQYNHTGINANFPVWLMCKPSDTGKVRASFINLSKAIMAFENAFGPQVYSKVIILYHSIPEQWSMQAISLSRVLMQMAHCQVKD